MMSCKIFVARMLPIVAILFAVAGCGQNVTQKENKLAAAGFVPHLPDTPARLASMKTLPPHKFVRQVRNGQMLYVYSDPTLCGCVYVGDQKAYSNYRHEVFEQHLADEQQATASMDQDYAMEWSAWGPWAPFYYY
ncbi:Hypothetical protein GbCGDNIH9_0181 [Granulibacter bethesdensis]|uniref:Secreted protein n=2 Tax=Granulibacter bethesdensis TaxID=364410 RepID=A0AAC9P7J3_9PROT|nr:Hypothetical protein GbCGDNIH9_0181 [Granulibacter bethesdensis]APH60980.1 Hypothetical protein GbCGDNIH8_0181 [Granulibacter bethesdensis]